MTLSHAEIVDLLTEAARRSPRRLGLYVIEATRTRPVKTVADGALRDAVLRIVRERGPVRAKHVAAALGKRAEQIAPQLSRLCDQDEIVRLRHGVYGMEAW